MVTCGRSLVRINGVCCAEFDSIVLEKDVTLKQNISKVFFFVKLFMTILCYTAGDSDQNRSCIHSRKKKLANDGILILFKLRVAPSDSIFVGLARQM